MNKVIEVTQNNRKWLSMSQNMQRNVRNYLERHKNDVYAASLLSFLIKNKYLTDNQINNLPDEAWR